jgi:TRAP-type C4-dicarboxylate transport system permease small subunit
MGRALQRLSEILALIGGALILLIVAMTVVSIAGRYFFNIPVRGDFEITEIACGVAAFLFFPYTQATGQNLVADFFTSGFSPRGRAWIEALHTFVFAVLAAFLAWRGYEGLVDKIVTSEKTMLIGVPVWVPYAVAVPCLAVLAAVCLWGSAKLLADERH